MATLLDSTQYIHVLTCTVVNKGVIEGENLFEGSQNSIVMTTELKEKEISQSILAINF